MTDDEISQMSEAFRVKRNWAWWYWRPWRRTTYSRAFVTEILKRIDDE